MPTTSVGMAPNAVNKETVMNRILFHTLLLAIVVAPCSVWGQVNALSGPGQREEETIPTVKFQFHPAAPPRAALKYQLLPGFLDRTPGNAAVAYNKMGIQLSENNDKELGQTLSKWLLTPLADLPREEIEKKLTAHQRILDALDREARREQCDWELPLREENPIAMLLPEVRPIRTFGRLLAVQARLQIAKGEYDEAIHSLQTGYALGRHVAEGETLVNALVGMAICDMMSDQVEVLIQQPDSPNLYWALTSLPRPIISLRKAAEAEMSTVYLMFPGLRDVDDGARDPEYWRQFLDRVSSDSRNWWWGSKPEMGWRPAFTMLTLKGYPDAKRALLEQGRSPEEVEAMPVAQVVALHVVQTYDELRDEIFKWFALPYWQAEAGMKKATRDLHRDGRSREIIPVASMLLPAVSAAKTAEARAERRIALLRMVEAVRMHAAAHEGRPPAKRDDIDAMKSPLPIDPLTGKPFDYRLDGDTAVIDAPADIVVHGRRYEMRVK